MIRTLRTFIGRGALESDDAIRGLFRFVLAGLLTTAIYFVLATFFHWMNMRAELAGAVALVLCWVISYAAQSRLTFRVDGFRRGDVLRFLVMSVGGIFIVQLCIIVLHRTLDYPLWVANAAVCVLIPIFNFLAMNFWVFAMSAKRTAP